MAVVKGLAGTPAVDHVKTAEEWEAENEALRAELAKAQANSIRELKLKVSDKGGVSVYGLQARFPVTLYQGQWTRLIDFMPEIQKFIAANKTKLSSKVDGVVKAAA